MCEGRTRGGRQSPGPRGTAFAKPGPGEDDNPRGREAQYLRRPDPGRKTVLGAERHSEYEGRTRGGRQSPGP